jgi:hypothetical protein
MHKDQIYQLKSAVGFNLGREVRKKLDDMKIDRGVLLEDIPSDRFARAYMILENPKNIEEVKSKENIDVLKIYAKKSPTQAVGNFLAIIHPYEALLDALVTEVISPHKTESESNIKLLQQARFSMESYYWALLELTDYHAPGGNEALIQELVGLEEKDIKAGLFKALSMNDGGGHDIGKKILQKRKSATDPASFLKR